MATQESKSFLVAVGDEMQRSKRISSRPSTLQLFIPNRRTKRLSSHLDRNSKTLKDLIASLSDGAEKPKQDKSAMKNAKRAETCPAPPGASPPPPLYIEGRGFQILTSFNSFDWRLASPLFELFSISEYKTNPSRLVVKLTLVVQRFQFS